MFAMLFTAGMSLFLYTFTLNHQYDQASQYSNQAQASTVGEQLTLRTYPVQGRETTKTNLSTSISNVGSNASTIIDFFVRNQTGMIVCNSGLAVIPSTPTCATQLQGNATVNVLPNNFSLGIGQSVNLTTSLSSGSPSSSVYTCTVKNVCSVNVVTSLGNVFTGSYPLASPLGVIITTALNATQISPKQYVSDSALLTGASPTAGGTVTYYWYTDGDCGVSPGNGGIAVVRTPLPAVTVTNGVVPNSAAVKFTGQGEYSFKAAYSGDVNNPSATSACEPLNVAQPGVCVPSATNFCFATVAQGIGSIAFDFNSFKWYNLTTTSSPTSAACTEGGSIGGPPTAGCYLNRWGVNTAPVAYAISTAKASVYNIGFSVNITNADPLGRTISLNAYTQLWFSYLQPGSGGGQAHSYYYSMVNLIAGTNQISTASPGSATMSYGQTVTLYFVINAGGNPANKEAGHVTPVFIFFVGNIGPTAQPFGQDFPLAATLWQ